MDYQILFTDLDGTLLNDGKVISKANKQAAAKALSAGKKIIISSGRSWMSMARFEAELGINRPGDLGSSFNGAVVYEYLPSGISERKFLSSLELSNTLGLQVVNRLKELGGDVLVYTKGELFAERSTDCNKIYSETSRLPIHFVEDFSYIKDGIIKILAQGALSELKELHREMTQAFKDKVYMVLSCPWLLEFGALAAHKGNAVNFITNHLHIPLNKVIAMGDEANDITMLQTAGLGIAVANATDETKKSAKIVLPCDNNNDAFAKVVEEYL